MAKTLKDNINSEEITNDEKGLIYIKIEKLFHHPDNPRKHLGELGELSESIKKNGILQNLTVVPSDTGYFVVIGNRRLEAAKLAGLKELPCVIASLSYKEQISTMLVENMQRSDLTPYEQAQGFQMMLDFGDSVEVIAEKSGFSESTVRRRVKLLELDEDKFKASEARNVSMFEYMELDKIKDIELRNEILEYAGTENFNYKLKQALDKEKKEAKRAENMEILDSFAKKVDSTKGYDVVRRYYGLGYDDLKKPEDCDTVEYFYSCDDWGGVNLLVKVSKKTKEETEEEKQRKEQERLRREREGAIGDISKRMFELRREFIDTVSSATVKKYFNEIVAYWMKESICDTTGNDGDEVVEAFGIEVDEDEEYWFDKLEVLSVVKKSPEKAFLKLIYLNCDDLYKRYNDWHYDYEKNPSLDRLYELLTLLGYEMSDEEKAMQNGTHKLFEK